MRELSFLNKGLIITLNDERESSKDEDGEVSHNKFYSENKCF